MLDEQQRGNRGGSMRKDDRLYKLNKVVERIEDQKGDYRCTAINESVIHWEQEVGMRLVPAPGETP